MKRVILDTHIYGLIAVDDERERIKNSIVSSVMPVYGSYIIRKELRNTKRGYVDGINLRNILLSLYQEITRNRELKQQPNEKDMAGDYFTAYRQLGGNTSFTKLQSDFLIVASATLNNLDIVVSEDNATMINDLTLKAYTIVNNALKLRTPRFIGYGEFKKELKK